LGDGYSLKGSKNKPSRHSSILQKIMVGCKTFDSLSL
jgi:hypothetical protein